MSLVPLIISYIKSIKLDKYSYTLIIRSSNAESFEEIFDQLKNKIENFNKSKNKISDSRKSSTISSRLYQIKSYMENIPSDNKKSFNELLIVNSELKSFKLDKNTIKFCNEWNISKFIFLLNNDLRDGIEGLDNYIETLLTDKNVKTVLKFDKSDIFVNKLDFTKSMNLEKHSSNENNLDVCLKKYNPLIVYGVNPLVKKKSDTNSELYHYKNLSKEEILDIIDNYEILKNQNKLKEIFLDNINNPKYDGKFLIGSKENSWGLENSMIKTLFINPKLYNGFISNNDFKDLISNVEVIIVQPKTAGDIGQQFNKNYGGIVGLKYY